MLISGFGRMENIVALGNRLLAFSPFPLMFLYLGCLKSGLSDKELTLYQTTKF